ncbi:MAG: ribosome maturation factor RimM [Oscillospiraceae bacterium]
MEKYLEAGKIVNTHGIKGEVKIEPWVNSAEFLLQFKLLYIDGKPFKLLGGKTHKQCLIASLEGISDVNTAMILKNKTVFIDRADAKLQKGEFFLRDLIGAEASDEKGNIIGKLSEVLELPAGNVYVIKGEREILVPAVPEFVLKTDVEAGKITLRLIDGM